MFSSSRNKWPKMFESLIVCAKIVVFPQGQCEEGPFDVVIERGLIAAIDRCKGECGNDKLTCHYLTPGFIDIHNHGMGRIPILNIVSTIFLNGLIIRVI